MIWLLVALLALTWLAGYFFGRSRSTRELERTHARERQIIHDIGIERGREVERQVWLLSLWSQGEAARHERRPEA